MSIFEKFKKTIAALRDPVTGCPWDKEQTHTTLKPFLIEESYEFLEAVDNNNDLQMKDELGDILLQVFLHSQLASERNAFTIEDVFESINEKMIRRHPHVFADSTCTTSEDVMNQWKEIKQSEKKQESVLDGIPTALPALLRAQKLGSKIKKTEFDFKDTKEAWSIVQEEFRELEKEIEEENHIRVGEEIADLIATLCHLARKNNIQIEEATHRSLDRFENRFRAVEKLGKELGKTPEQLSRSEYDELWKKVKLFEK